MANWTTDNRQSTKCHTPAFSSIDYCLDFKNTTYTRLTALCPELPGEPVPESKTNLGLLEQETVSGSGISWAICKSAPRPRHNHASIPPLSFCRPDALPAAQQHQTQQYCENNRWYSIHVMLQFTSFNSVDAVYEMHFPQQL